MNIHIFSGGTGEHIHSVECQVNTHTLSGGTGEHIQWKDR